MAFPAAPGVPNYSGTMIPELWSSQLLVKFYEETVLTGISNTKYEGEIKNQGDTVHIRSTPTIQMHKHVRGAKLNYETPEPSITDLLIDRGVHWTFATDDVSDHQADYDYINDWTSDAGKQQAIFVDREVLGEIYADADPANAGATAGAISNSFNMGVTGTPLVITKANIINYIVNAGAVLDEQNAPSKGKFIVLPAWACAMISGSDLKDASLSGDRRSLLRTDNGLVGEISGFMVYRSNLLSIVTDGANQVTNAIFGTTDGLTFANQFTKNEGPMRSPETFGDLYRGLQVYGFKVIKPEAIGHMYMRPDPTDINPA